MNHDLFNGINFLAVISSTIVYYIIGFIWYTLLFGKLWQEETGVVLPDKPSPWKLAGQFVSTLLYTLGIAIILSMYGQINVASGIFISLIITIFIIIPVNSGNLFFTNKKKLFLLDVSERAIGSVIVGIILGAWN